MNKSKAQPLATLGYMKQLDARKIRVRRAGIIVYTVIGDEVFFGLGIDSKHSELTDFGGGVDINRDRDAIDTAIREFAEESLGVFGVLTRDIISNCFVIHDKSSLIVFVHLEVDPKDVSDRFEIARKSAKHPEVDVIVWLKTDQLMHEIHSEESAMYSVVRQLLSTGGNFIEWL